MWHYTQVFITHTHTIHTHKAMNEIQSHNSHTDVDSSLKGPLCTMATKTAAKNDPVVSLCEQCNQYVEKDRHECQKQEGKLKNLQEISLELQEQQQVTVRLQGENRNLLNELNGVIRNQQRDHSQVWVIIITIAVAILLTLVKGLSQEQTVTITQQESVNMTHVQTLNKSMAELAQSLEQLKKMSQADKETSTAMLEALKKVLEVQETAFNRSVHELEQDFVNITQSLNTSFALLTHVQQELTQLRKILCPGSTANRPASSCGQILSCDPSSTSGYYWIASADGNRTVHMYCSMSETCEKCSGGWMRVAELDMTNSSNQCPNGLWKRKHHGQRLCTKDTDDGGCSNVFFKVSNISYDQVCGKIIAYQYGSPNSFHTGGPIDGVYVDGISLTNGEPRKHIWSFGAGLDEVGSYPSSNCPCTNTTLASNATPPPDFVGDDYFCDTGSTNEYQKKNLYSGDPLWDGDGCGPDNTCCSLNNPPWFFKQLQSSTSEDIEMRVCCDESHDDEDIYIKQIELYVR